MSMCILTKTMTNGFLMMTREKKAETKLTKGKADTNCKLELAILDYGEEMDPSHFVCDDPN